MCATSNASQMIKCEGVGVTALSDDSIGDTKVCFAGQKQKWERRGCYLSVRGGISAAVETAELCG